MFFPRKMIALVLFFTCCNLFAIGQRTYRNQSVLASGVWYQVSVADAGIHQLNINALNALGMTGSIPSGQVRLFGRKGTMLPEANNAGYQDDLEELAIQVVDGGDGVLNGADYILFYAAGPHQWTWDSLRQQPVYRKNLYSDQSFFYITVGGTGKRVSVQNNPPPASAPLTTFDERWHHELDSVNFLASGKEWYGEEFANLPGRTLVRSFSIPLTNVAAGPLTLVSSLVARSAGNPASFEVLLNNSPAQRISIPAVGTGIYDLFAQQAEKADAVTVGSGNLSLTYQFIPGSFNAQGWINWFQLFFRRNLVMPQSRQLHFRNSSSTGSSVTFQVTGAGAGSQVWDVTDPLNPLQMDTKQSGEQLQFSNDANFLKEYIAFSGSYLIPKAVGKVSNQNLHATAPADYFIITPPAFLAQAQRIAAFHQKRNGLKTVVATTQQVYHEFSAGVADPSAIRDFVKMYYDRYAATWHASPKYLLLLGKGSFDYKSRTGNHLQWVLPYESVNSLDPLGTYTSDDFFGFLDDAEDINTMVKLNLLDIGIGRIPAANAEEAKAFVDKLESYHSAASFGPWRNRMNFVADDEDNNLHLQDAEVLTTGVESIAPVFDVTKIYLDAFPQEGSSAGGRYPQVNDAINNNIAEGTLIWNYSGHGGPSRLAEEVILEHQTISRWNNAGKLPLVITATCDFAPYDRPGSQSLGEHLMVRPVTGAIALLTTTRTVFAFSNRIINHNYLQAALKKDSAGNYPTLGQSLVAAKNHTYQTFGDIVNNRKFTLLGDPAMRLAFPKMNVVPLTINGHDITAAADTVSAAENVVLEGAIRDENGSLVPDFNGVVYLSLFDKVKNATTLGNDPGSAPVAFPTQASLLFKGKSTAQNGRFSFKFTMPRDITYQPGMGKISLYAADGTTDAHGFSDSIYIGGMHSGAVTDADGPSIKAFMNDDRFVNGSITNKAPLLVVQLEDSSGINISGSIDHDIIATLDNDNSRYFVLNNYYESELDNFRKGSIRFQLPELTAGPHSLKIKAWDALNNSSEYILEFIVVNNEDLVVDHVLNYPNPFTTQTSFCFEHNQPATELKVHVSIYSIAGKLVKTIRQTINTTGNRSCEVTWDGRDDHNNKVGRGIYIYRLQINAHGKHTSKLEKLVLIN